MPLYCSGVGTLANYESDLKNLTYHFSSSKIPITDQVTNGLLVAPTSGQSKQGGIQLKCIQNSTKLVEHVRKPFKWHFLKDNKIINFNSNCYEIYFLETKIDYNPKLDKLMAWHQTTITITPLNCHILSLYAHIHPPTLLLGTLGECKHIWVRSRRCGCLLPGFAQLIAKSDNKTAELPWHGSYTSSRVCEWMHVNNYHDFVKWSILIRNALMSFCDKELNFQTNYFN